MQDKAKIHEGHPQPVLLSARTRFTLVISNHMDPRLKRFIQTRLKLFTISRATKNYPGRSIGEARPEAGGSTLQIGDLVRVRTREEIQATLNANGWLRGCKFMPEMAQFCGTTQRVFKPVNRFLNECDYTVRKTRGIVLLENVFCQGVAGAGECDRSCFYFWRVEWLERMDEYA
jgi:hypothetical protein